ncbi:MAG: YegS/Rv2252/BmrU family lipid kinase [bacterium]|nr:YegS/Rv2252/BmrU family lipid kinase [bacterium]MDE0353004.1 YegS/Rv2252/BmrU family lipid kinase [bacterium]
MTPWLVLVNPHAGRGRSAKADAVAALRSHSVPADVLEVDGLGALGDAVKEAASADRRRLVAVGGDGTVNAVLNEIMAHGWSAAPLLGILPAGTGCDLLRTFGIGPDLDRAAARLIEGTPYPVDVGLAMGEWGRRYFLNVASAGATAAAARTAQRIPARLGSFRYVAAVAASLPSWRRLDARVEAGRREFSGPALTVVAANAQFFGGGFNIAPRASMVDGLLDIQVISSRRREVAALMRKARGGDHLADPGVRRFVAPEARIEANPPWPVEVDGEPIGRTPLLVRLRAGSLRLMI